MTQGSSTYQPEAIEAYTHNYAYLQDELEKLDECLRLRIAALHQQRAAREHSESNPFYITSADVEGLLDEDTPDTIGLEDFDFHLEILQYRIDDQVAASLERGVFLGLPYLAALFDLSDFEREAVLICLAPELQRKYDTLYAYAQDDVTRKRPSVDLVLDLLCATETEKWNLRALLSSSARLMQTGILERVEDAASPSGSSDLAQFLRLDPRILDYLLGHQTVDARLATLVQVCSAEIPTEALPMDPALAAPVLAFAQRYAAAPATHQKLVLYLHGSYGVGKRALAQAVASSVGRPLLSLDAHRLLTQEAEAEALLGLACRESFLWQAPLYVENADMLLRSDDRARTLRKTLAQATQTSTLR